MESFEIAGRAVGPGEPPYVIAEAGVHHRNNVELALRYIEAAHAAGADAIKFQTYSADRLATRWAPLYWSGNERDGTTERTQHDIFAERSLLSEEDYRRLAEHAAASGITFLSTPFDGDAANMLDRLGVPAFKIASADITHLPLLRRVASFAKPILLSTGASTMEEVADAVRILRDADVPFALLHCSLSYPTRIADANLRRLEMLSKVVPGAILGYSDHTLPEETELACPVAVALGARVIEKHFTLDRTLPEDDHYHSVNPRGLERLVAACREAAILTPTPDEIRSCERPARENARRSVVAARDLPAGVLLQERDLDFKRPGRGLAPSRLAELLGRRLTRSLNQDDLVRLEDLE